MEQSDKKTIYPDILAMAITNPTEEQKLTCQITDHGLLDDDALNLLLKRRMDERFKHQSYVEQLPNGEIWTVYPDGTKELTMDANGNFVTELLI